MSPEENPVVATGTGKKQRLSRENVLSAALALVNSDGLDALTIRRLGQELGRDRMSLYRYAANRAALLDGVSELVLNNWPSFRTTRTGRPNCGALATTYASWRSGTLT